MGIPVVIVTSGGLGVTVVSSGGIPMTVATSGHGIPVMSVTNGLPVTGITFGPDVTAPVITSASAVSQPENAILNHVLAANETVTWAKVGGADTAKFTLVGNTLTLPAKDFENPDDTGLNNTYVVQVQATDTASNVSLVQTITVTITDVFEVGPTAPVLAMDPAWVTTDSTPDFTIDVDDTIGAGDSVQLQIAAAGTSFAAPVDDVTHVITAPEDAANEIALASGAVSNGNYEARARVNDGTLSAWSNTVSFTVAAVGTGHGLMWGTSAIMWGAEYQTWDFTPASLSPVLWLEARNGLFQTITATTPATANGDVVGTWSDLSGNGFHLAAAANDGTRPTLQGVGTFSCVRYNGTSSLLFRNTALGMFAAGSCSMFVAYKSNTPSTAARFIQDANIGGGGVTWYGPVVNSTTATTASMAFRNDAGVQTLNFTTPTVLNAFDNTDRVLGMTDDGTVPATSQVNMYLDQGAAVSVTYARSVAALLNQFNLGGLQRSGPPSSWWKGDIYAVVVVNGTVLSAGQRADLVTYLAALQGRTI